MDIFDTRGYVTIMLVPGLLYPSLSIESADEWVST